MKSARLATAHLCSPPGHVQSGERKSINAGERSILDTSETAANYEPAPIARVLVVGAGTMGSGIAQVIAQAGIPTTLTDADSGSLERGLAAIASRWQRLAETGRRSPEDIASFRANLSPGTIADAANADLVIEAIIEKPRAKIRAVPGISGDLAAIVDFRLEHLIDLDLHAWSYFGTDPTASSDSIFSTRCRCFRWSKSCAVSKHPTRRLPHR